jgi:two-component system phosphate regulon response regulator PhoB
MEKRKRICLLEDNNEIREIIEMLLESEFYEVFAFSTVKEFLKKAIKLHPDAYVLDVMLPDGNGYEVCNRLKADDFTHEIPVLMMSANFVAQDYKKNCLAEDYISKPFDIYDFVNRVKKQVFQN